MNPYIVAAFTTNATSKIREQEPKAGPAVSAVGALLTLVVKKTRLE
jgi:hypothetical protein